MRDEIAELRRRVEGLEARVARSMPLAICNRAFGEQADMTKDQNATFRIAEINRELEKLREQRSKMSWSSPDYELIREEISALLRERDSLSR